MDINSFELTLSQQFSLRQYQDSVTRLSREDLDKLFIEAMRLIMIKDNIIRDLAKDTITYGKQLL